MPSECSDSVLWRVLYGRMIARGCKKSNREQDKMRRICGLRRSTEFPLYAIHGGWSRTSRRRPCGSGCSGTASRTSQQIAEELDRLGANLSTSAGLDECTVSLSALKANLDASLAVFADVVLNPSFPQDEFERQRTLQLAGIQREKTQPVTMAYRVLPALLYGEDSAYGNPLTGSGTEESVKAIERDALVQFHNDWFKPNNATLIVVGDTTLDEIAPKLESLFADWSREQTPRKTLATAPPAKPGVYLMDRPGAAQSIVIAAELAPPKSDADDIAFEAFDWAFGGAFIARLNMNLREDKHWSYGARSILYPAVGPRIYFAYAPVQTDKTKE